MKNSIVIDKVKLELTKTIFLQRARYFLILIGCESSSILIISFFMYIIIIIIIVNGTEFGERQSLSVELFRSKNALKQVKVLNF